MDGGTLEQEPWGMPVMAGSMSISNVSVLCTLGARYSGLEAMSMRMCKQSDSKSRVFFCSPPVQKEMRLLLEKKVWLPGVLALKDSQLLQGLMQICDVFGRK